MALSAHLRKLTHELNKHSSVHQAKLSLHEICVKYKNGLSERWIHRASRYKKNCCWIYFLPDRPGSPFDEFVVGQEYEANPLDDDYEEKLKYFAVRPTNYLSSTFASRRLGIQNLINRMTDEGWMEIEYPHDALISDFVKFRSDNLNRFDRGSMTEVHGYGASIYHGLKILEHFVPWGSFGNEKSMNKAWSRPFNLYSAITHLIKIKHSITRSEVAKALRVSSYGAGVRMYAPNLYRAIFTRFDVEGITIADPDPGIGSKALAAISRDCEYYYGPGPFAAAANEIGRFLGVEFHRIEEREKFDLAILDSNWNTDIHKLSADIKKWREKADMLLLYVPKECYDRIRTSFLPISTHRINVEFIYHDSPDYLMLI